MKPKTMILAILAITCGIGASYMTSRLLAERQPPEEEKVTILVAKRSLSFGERIKNPEEMFEPKAIAKENEPPDAIKEFDVLKGKMLKQSRNKGDHVTPASLYDKDGLDIPEGHQAVGVPVNMVTTAHGWASLPGSRVDLILTRRGNDDRSFTARVLLENVLVLAADGRTNREGDMIAPASVVLFALKDRDSLTVKVAEQMGSLSLALRRLKDTTHAQTRVVTGDDIMSNKGKDEEPAVAKAVPVKPAPPPPPVAPTPEPTLPPAEPPVVKAPEPKGTLQSLLIVNGKDQSRSTTRVLENGEPVENDAELSEPAPPRPQPRPIQKQVPPPKGPREV